jgi:hypothetical protein
MTGRGPDLDEAREYWGRSRYEPAGVDPEELASALVATSPGDGLAPVLARSCVELAAADPDRARTTAGRLEPFLDDDDAGEPAARALAHVATVDESAARTLYSRLRGARGNALRATVEGVRLAAERNPEAAVVTRGGLVLAVADAVGPPATATPDYPGDPNRRGCVDGNLEQRNEVEPARIADAGVAALALAAGADPAVCSDLVDLLDHPDRGRRACGARAVGAAAGNGVDPAVAALPEVVDLLDATMSALRSETILGVAAAAGASDQLVDEVGRLASIDGDERTRTAATRALTALAREDRVVFESLLNLIADGEPLLSGLLGDVLGWTDLDRAMVAVARAADAHPATLGRHEPAVSRLFDDAIYNAARAVRRAGAERPEVFGAAVGRLFGAIDRYPARSGEPFYRALATIAPEFPVVGRRLVRWLAKSGSRKTIKAAAVCEHLTEVDPVALRNASAVVRDRRPTAVWNTSPGVGDRRLTADELLGELVVEGRALVPAARALARLGRRYPVVVEPVADNVAARLDAFPSVDMDRPHLEAVYELAGVVTHVVPESVARVGLSGVTDDTADIAVPYLSSYCSEFPDAVDSLVERLDDDVVRRPVLRALATTAGNSPAAVAPHVPRVLVETERRHWQARRDATKAVASAAAGIRNENGSGNQETAGEPAVRERLTSLAYDPEPEVRRWAAFGLGELADDGPDPSLARLSRIADHESDEVRSAATLGLVRAGRIEPLAAVESLVSVATGPDRPMAEAAVDALEDDQLHDALRRVDEGTTDPRIRDRVRASLAGGKRRAENTD